MATKFVKDFQAFISRGNVIDMAVGVIVGAAFSAIVNSMVKDVVNPLLGFIVGSQDFSHLPRGCSSLSSRKRHRRIS